MSPTRNRSNGIRFSGVAILACLLAGGLGAPVPGAAQGQGNDVTYSRDIAPILQRSCVKCHRPNSLAPMPLNGGTS